MEQEFRKFVKESIIPVLEHPDYLQMLIRAPIANMRDKQSGVRIDQAKEIIEVFVQESIQAFDLIERCYDKSSSILEVGGGIGLVNIWLQVTGYDVKSIEPSGGGHDDYYAIGSYLVKELKLDSERWVDLSVEDVSSLDQTFDLLFSYNVLEHIKDVDIAFDQMKQCLNGNGVMRHGCPNYAIPYEPHYGIPLLPGLEVYTPILLPYLRGESLWNSLNFIKAKKLQKVCEKHKLNLVFDRGSTHAAVERLYYDRSFSQRHEILAYIFRFIKRTPLLTWIKSIPPQYATPMSFSIRF